MPSAFAYIQEVTPTSLPYLRLICPVIQPDATIQLCNQAVLQPPNWVVLPHLSRPSSATK